VLMASDYSAGIETLDGFEEGYGAGELPRILTPYGRTPDLAPYLERIPRDAELLYAFYAGGEAVAFAKAFRQLGYDARIDLLTCQHLTDEDVLSAVGRDAEGIVSVAAYAPGLENPENTAFVAKWQTRTGQNPSVVAVQSWDAMRLVDLARHMIVTSSNLATNLLLDAVGIDQVRKTLDDLGVEGVELRRGVEDERAFQEGINNRVTAEGLVQVLRLIEERRALSAEACDQMLEILHAQEFRSGIPAGLPDDARVANKTGEISTVAHDTGLVYLPDRKPYALAILTEWSPNRTSGRRETLANISRAIYEHLTEGED